MPVPRDKEVRGTLDKIVFHNAENGYTVARLRPEAPGRDLVTIVGTFSHPIAGESLVCYGAWTSHPQFGAQMLVERYDTVRPATALGVEKYLGSGMVPGLGPVMAKRIVKKFGADALDVIEETPQRLLEVEGIGEKRLDFIRKAVADQREIRSIMLFLQQNGVSPAYAVRIYKTYHSTAISVVENNPYQLAQDVWGIGFQSADRIAGNLGFEHDDPRRIAAGVEYVLNESVENEGHVFLTREELEKESCAILGVANVDGAIQRLAEANRVVIETAGTPGGPEAAIYTPVLLKSEIDLAERLKALIGSSKSASLPMPDASIQSLMASLSAEQQSAVQMAMSSRLLVLTGGPGTGKTTTTKAIVAALSQLGRRIVLGSPTGRAAKRLSEVVGRDASTVHRILVFEPDKRKFFHDENNPIECDTLLVDEASMLDLPLACSLLKALRPTAQLILVGDVDQLPSVGPGNILGDLIASRSVPVARLTTIFRQAAQSKIIVNAHRVNSGAMPELASPRTDSDCVFIEADDADDLAQKIVAIVMRSLPRRGFDIPSIQVLTPMQRGAAGAANLNRKLQEAINPPSSTKTEVARGDRIFREGDRVIQLRNNYDKNVYNGDIGQISEINVADETVLVHFGEADTVYDVGDLDELALAYALSIHKSQGSEFPVAVIAVHTQHYTLLQRNLIYTALTRARKMAVLVGSKKAIAIAVRTDRQVQRHTRLRQRLRGEI
jgi:exodeoxyribonuclease V alpha subunit